MLTHVSLQRNFKVLLDCSEQKCSLGRVEVSTCLEAGDGEGGLGQEVLIVEHVDLIHYKSQEGKLRVADGEMEGLPWPYGV